MEIHVGTHSYMGCYLCLTLSVDENGGYKKTFYLNPDTGFWENDCRNCWFKEERKSEIVGRFATNLFRITGI